MSENNGTELNFDDPEPIRLPVTIGGRRFVLREASTDVAVKYRNTGTKAARMQDGKLVGIDGGADVVFVLVQGCLFEVKTDGPRAGQEGPVSPTFVRELPYRITKTLFDKTKEISKGLEDEDTVESLTEQITKLTEQRDKLAAMSEKDRADAEEGVGKGSPPSTTANST